MCLHHRTIAYRISRIEELTGLSLQDTEQRFRAQLACKILALRDGAEPGLPGQI
jgi:DNA-binding PucR family transcriptional regulator